MPKTRPEYEEQHRIDLERIRELEAEVKSLKLQNDILIWKPIRPGRKPKLTEQVIKNIKQLRSEGKTQREIAGLLSISIGLVNKGCNQ
jgi:DNA invertase Pin-like site-specific DNA recombinase